MKKCMLPLLFLLGILNLKAQDAVSYQTPPKEMADLLLAKPTPFVYTDSKAEWILLADWTPYLSVSDLAMPELRVAGLRINPNNFAPSRQYFINNLTLKNIKSGQTFPVTGLPVVLKAGNVRWSPNEKKISFTQTNPKSVDLYVIDVAIHKAMKINKAPLNLLLRGFTEVVIS